MLLLAGGLTFYRTSQPTGPIVQLGVEEKTLIAYNEQGQELWRHGFPHPFHNVYAPVTRHKFSWIGDIDGDGKTETLFVYRSVNESEDGTPLFCFSETGQVKWQFFGGREVHNGKQRFSGVYFPFITVLPKHKQIIVSSNHSVSDPQQIALLNGDGKLLAEYWHMGHLRDLAVADWSGSGGDEELLMPGIDQNRGQAELVVLPLKMIPPPIMGSASLDLPLIANRGGEKAIVLFPKSCITQKLGPFNLAFLVKLVPIGFEVFVYESHTPLGDPPLLIYTFNPKLEVIGLTVSSTLLARHKQLEADGTLGHSFSESESNRLREGVVVIRQ